MEKEMISFNSEFTDFDLQQLENRLETDPLAVGGLVDIATNPVASPDCVLYCPRLESCPELK